MKNFKFFFRSVCSCQNNDPGLAKLESLGRSGGLRFLRSPRGHAAAWQRRKRDYMQKIAGRKPFAQKSGALRFCGLVWRRNGAEAINGILPNVLFDWFIFDSVRPDPTFAQSDARLFVCRRPFVSGFAAFFLLYWRAGPEKKRGLLCSLFSLFGLRWLPILLRGAVCDGFFRRCARGVGGWGEDPARCLALRAPRLGPFRCACAAAGSNRPVV